MARLQLVNALDENARQYGYDLAGRMVTYAAADRVRTYTYDAAGHNMSTYGFAAMGAII